MTQYNSVNVKLSNSQIKIKVKLKLANEKVTLRISSNMIGDTADEANFSQKLLSKTLPIILQLMKIYQNHRFLR